MAPLAGVLEGTGDGSAWFAAGEDERTDGHGAHVHASFMDWDADLPQVGAVGISGDLSDCEDFFADGTGGVGGDAVRGLEGGVSSLSCDGDKTPEDRAAIADGQEEEWFAQQAERLRRANEKALQQLAYPFVANSSQRGSNA